MKYRIVDKNKSWVMKSVAWFLATFRIMPKDEFCWYTTVIRRTIYAPGGQCGPITLRHELKHVVQWFKHFLYPVRYLISSRFRARVEVEAYLTGQPGLKLSTLIKKLDKYRCSQKDVEAGWDWYHLPKFQWKRLSRKFPDPPERTFVCQVCGYIPGFCECEKYIPGPTELKKGSKDGSV